MKKYLLGFLALVLAIGFSAFTLKNNNAADVGIKKVAGSAWFQYVGPDNPSSSELRDYENYEYHAEASTCTGSGDICAVFYTYSNMTLTEGQNPNEFDVPFQDEIENDRDDVSDSANVTELSE